MSSSPLFFIHGWATNGQIWQDLFQSPYTHYYNAPQYPDFTHISHTFLNLYRHMKQQRITLVGWSLGGMLSLQLAHRFPEHIGKVILISSTACFTSRENYPAGLSPAIVKQLAKRLRQDYRQTQVDFYKLMFSAREKEAEQSFLTALAPLMCEVPMAALTAGLDYLLATDLRELLPHITVPCHIIHGSADEICPLAAGEYLSEHLPQAVLHILPNAGHIPFYTRFSDFQSALEECSIHD